MHGIKARERHDRGTHLNLRGWYEHRHKQRVDAQIRAILDLHRTPETADISEKCAMLPPIWSHKSEVLSGDTVYLGHNNHIRSFILSGINAGDPEEGKVSIASPIGSVLLGKHQGDKVHLRTIDGDLDYTVLKIL